MKTIVLYVLIASGKKVIQIFHQESAGLFWRRLAQVLLVFQPRAVDLDLVVEQGRPAMRFGGAIWTLIHPKKSPNWCLALR